MTQPVSKDWYIPFDARAVESGNVSEYLNNLTHRLNEVTDQIKIVTQGETGTFLPIAQGSGTAGTASSYSVQVGTYLKLGSLVWVTINLGWTDANHTGTTNLEIGELPYTSYTTAGHEVAFSCVNKGDFSGVALLAPEKKIIETIYDETGTQQSIVGKNYDLVISGCYRIAENG